MVNFAPKEWLRHIRLAQLFNHPLRPERSAEQIGPTNKFRRDRPWLRTRSYLRTDQSCRSLSQATAAGDAVYRVAGTDPAGVCAAVTAARGGTYGKWLDNTTPPTALINFG